ncbi:protein JINGUBANG-like [Salvia splendens]|uniref:protein JINGUBANG-like n=1 Tax=Salvia splendens TaxID=180675 RepID=UPI001103D3FE|nr:protein JINGUBANG-like [Salvia splendens]
MADVQSWLAIDNYISPSLIYSDSSLSLSSSSTTTRSAPSLCADSSFSSIRSSSSARTYYTYQTTAKPSASHFCISSTNAAAAHISCLAVHDGLLYAATIKGINVFDPANLALVETFGSGSGWAKSIAFTNGRIFTAHQDCKIRVWTPSISPKSKHRLITTLPTLKDRFHNCLSAKNYVKVRRNKRRLRIQHADAVSGLAVDADCGEIYSISWDKSFKTWKTTSDIQCIDSVNLAHSDAVNAVAVAGGTVYTGSADGQIKVWRATSDGRKRRLSAMLSKHKSSVNALAVRPDGAGLVSGGGDGVILVWERRDGGGDGEDMDFFVACCLKGHKGAVLSLVCVGDLVISGSSDGRVRIWKYGKGFGYRGCCVAEMEGHCKPVKSVVVVEDEGLDGQGFSVISGSIDGEIRVWKVVISDHYSD